ncbi:hypothetical protein [Phreatobacter sp. AB_2022a]|uniref:hypothetical protein n=1 Tax=Phreatobacter sp. AB_2022a TaxID=3003134 RepID=UPI00228730A3|nr:hypothetical protein [Phreatobacter sp. AB_2022a]MCZ0733489.1 hypothetical protein [Phreatobacter sp. AB_2022a]
MTMASPHRFDANPGRRAVVAGSGRGAGKRRGGEPGQAEDLGKLWPGDGQADAPGNGNANGDTRPPSLPKQPTMPDPRERKEIGEAVADLDYPPLEPSRTGGRKS